MKKLLLVLAAVAASACSAFAQGTVSFNNNSAFTTTADRLVRDLAGAPLVGTNWVAQLYSGADANSLTALTDPVVRFRVPTTTSPGTWSGATRALPGFTSGQTATLQVRVWDGNLFANYAAAVAGGGIYGLSTPFTYTVPAAGSPPAAFFMEGLRGFTLVPEPSVIALGVLGAAALLLRRRK
jgi:hypothetical protein